MKVGKKAGSMVGWRVGNWAVSWVGLMAYWKAEMKAGN